MQIIDQKFTVSYQYPVIFSKNIFHIDNNALRNCFENKYSVYTKIYVIIDKGFLKYNPEIFSQIKDYFNHNLPEIKVINNFLEIEGGEKAKTNSTIVDRIVETVHLEGIDRHSYIMVLGGGSVIDTIGFAAAIAHRGIRLIRIPTTTLAQNDAAIGVKNGVNTFGKKNFTGTFAPPFAVINDFNFLLSLNERDWRSGISEAIKVGLIKDKTFFEKIKNDASKYANRNFEAMQQLIYTCADLHLKHIASGDAFEQGSARPLDFGHWAAHKLEYLTNFELRHGEAVAIGIAIDTVYSHLIGNISLEETKEVLDLMKNVGFKIFHSLLLEKDNFGNYLIINGLNEFREHLGGKLTITILDKIGIGKEVNQLDENRIIESINFIKTY